MRVDLPGLEDIARRMREMARRWPDIVAEEAEAVLELVVAMMESEVAQRTPAGVGGASGLRGSIAGEVQRKPGKTVGTVGTPLEYAKPVEYGRKAGTKPPTAPIELWVRRKLGKPATESEGIAEAIAWNMYHHDREGVHMFEEAFEENKNKIMAMLGKIPDRVTREVARRELQ